MGAVQSGIVAASNHVRHKMIESGKIPGKVYVQDHVTSDGFDLNMEEFREILRKNLLKMGLMKTLKLLIKHLAKW